MKIGKTKLTPEQFKALIDNGGWKISKVEKDQYKYLPKHMRESEHYEIYVSGNMFETKNIHNKVAVGGIDFLKHETKPKINEPEGNAYHYVIVHNTNVDDYSVLGLYKSGTPVPHWFDPEKDLKVYDNLI